MKPIRCAVVVLVLLFGSVGAAWADYAAIAYSTSTGQYGYSFGQVSRASAERVALQKCKANDAEAVVWVSNGWAAVAVGNDGSYGTGWSTRSRAAAEKIALRNVTGNGARILCWVASGN